MSRSIGLPIARSFLFSTGTFGGYIGTRWSQNLRSGVDLSAARNHLVPDSPMESDSEIANNDRVLGSIGFTEGQSAVPMDLCRVLPTSRN